MFSDANLPSVRISDCRIVSQMPVLVKRTIIPRRDALLLLMYSILKMRFTNATTRAILYIQSSQLYTIFSIARNILKPHPTTRPWSGVAFFAYKKNAGITAGVLLW